MDYYRTTSKMVKDASGGTGYQFGSADWSENAAALNASSTITVLPEPAIAGLVIGALIFLLKRK